MSWAASYQEQLNAEKAAGAGDAGQKTGENNNNGSPFRGFGSGASSAFGAPAAGGGFGAATNGNNSGFGAASKSGGGFGAQPASGGFGGFGATASSTSGRGAVGFGHQNRSGFGVSAQPAEQQQQTGIPARNTTTTPSAPTASVTSSFGLQLPRVDWSGQPTASPSQQMQAAYGQQQAAPAAKPTFGRQVAPQPAQNPVQFVAQHAPAVPVSSVLHHRRSPIEEAGEKPMNPEDVALLNKFLHRTVKMMTDHVVDVSRQQADPRSPLHSVLQFKELRLKDTLLKALDIMGYHQPSKIQEFALPLLLMEPPTNMIAQSQSGTGKTAAFVLTMLSRVVPENHWPQCVCLAPTYELAMQIGEVVNRMAKFMPNVKVHYAVKGTARLPHGFQLQEQIIIGTPGRMIDYLTKMRCFNPAKIVCLVLDEADVMISQQGHLDLSHRIYNTIENASPGVQTMLFSATYDQAVMEFAEKLIKDAVSVTLKREDLALSNIKQFFVECRDRDSKYQAVCDLYSGLIIASSVIFTRTRSAATWLAQKLKTKGHEVALLHGDMTVQERAAAIEAFKNGIYKVLITTNVCSRGIDVSQVTIVINYDLPYYVDRPDEPDNETYLHRIGRTGRFGKAGIAINFVDSIEDLYLVRKLESHFGKPIPKLDPSNLDELEAIEKEF